MPAWRGGQKGQAIVLIAIMLAVVVGMAALAIDGSRAYTLRRDLQAAVDAAALTAGDKLQQTGSYASAEQAATTIFGTNLRLYTAPACSPGYGSPGAASLTVTCTYSDGTVLTQVISDLGPQGSRFAFTATRSLQLQFGRILTSGSSPAIAGVASGGVNNLLYAPTLAALNQAGCGGTPGNSISVNGSGSLIVGGDVVSNGAINISGGSVSVAGDIYAHCQSTIAGSTTKCYPSGAATPCTYPDVAGAIRSGYRLADPNYPPPPVAGAGQPRPANNVVISPGVYSANPAFAARCYFLSGGAYKWQAGYTNNGGLVSNELKPPDEPNPSNIAQLANPQFWNLDGVKCAGSFRFNVTGSGGSNLGTWGVKLTSVRTDSNAGTNYQRESAPSRCQSFTVQSAQTIRVEVSNVPGATSYNIYMSRSACSGPFGFAYNLPVMSSVQNSDTSGCPFGNGNGQGNDNGNGNGNNNNNCTLGVEALTVAAGILPALPLPNLFALPGTGGAYPPDGETAPLAANLPNQNPDSGVPPAGDRANENHCTATGGAQAACPAAITPGAVVYYIPSGSCLTDPNGGDNYLFSGYQFNWMAIYEPGAGNPPANMCSNVMGASTSSAYIGLVYVPAAAMSIPTSSGFRVEATGGVIANTITFTGQLPRIDGSSAYMPVPPPSRLTS